MSIQGAASAPSLGSINEARTPWGSISLGTYLGETNHRTNGHYVILSTWVQICDIMQHKAYTCTWCAHVNASTSHMYMQIDGWMFSSNHHITWGREPVVVGMSRHPNLSHRWLSHVTSIKRTKSENHLFFVPASIQNWYWNQPRARP